MLRFSRRRMGNLLPLRCAPCNNSADVGMSLLLTRRLQFFALVTLVVVSGCGSGRLVAPVSLEAGALPRPHDARDLFDHERAVRGIAAILHHDLELPVPDHVTVYVYGSRKVFERGLVQD